MLRHFLVKTLLVCSLASIGGFFWHRSIEPVFELRTRIHVQDIPEAQRTFSSSEELKALLEPPAFEEAPEWENRISQLISDLKLELVGDRHIEFSYQTKVPETGLDDLTQVMDAFIENQSEQEKTPPQISGRSIEMERESITQELEQLETLEEVATGDELQILTERVRLLAANLEKRRADREELQKQSNFVKKELEEFSPFPEIMSKLPEGVIRELLAKTSEQFETREEYRKQQEALEKLTKIYGKKHSKVTSALASLAQLRRKLPTSTGLNEDHLMDSILLLVTQISEHLASIVREEKEIEERLNSEKAQMKGLARQVQERVERTTQLKNRLLELSSNSEQVPTTGTQKAEYAQLPWVLPETVTYSLRFILICCLGSGFLVAVLWQTFDSENSTAQSISQRRAIRLEQAPVPSRRNLEPASHPAGVFIKSAEDLEDRSDVPEPEACFAMNI